MQREQFTTTETVQAPPREVGVCDAGGVLEAARARDAVWRAGQQTRWKRSIRMVRAGGWLLDRGLGGLCAAGGVLLVILIIASFRPMLTSGGEAKNLIGRFWLAWVVGLYVLAAFREAVEPLAEWLERRCRKSAKRMGIELD